MRFASNNGRELAAMTPEIAPSMAASAQPSMSVRSTSMPTSRADARFDATARNASPTDLDVVELGIGIGAVELARVPVPDLGRERVEDQEQPERHDHDGERV